MAYKVVHLLWCGLVPGLRREALDRVGNDRASIHKWIGQDADAATTQIFGSFGFLERSIGGWNNRFDLQRAGHLRVDQTGDRAGQEEVEFLVPPRAAGGKGCRAGKPRPLWIHVNGKDVPAMLDQGFRHRSTHGSTSVYQGPAWLCFCKRLSEHRLNGSHGSESGRGACIHRASNGRQNMRR